jgi:hypothetical protein
MLVAQLHRRAAISLRLRRLLQMPLSSPSPQPLVGLQKPSGAMNFFRLSLRHNFLHIRLWIMAVEDFL